jgi:hypothetical protein
VRRAGCAESISYGIPTFKIDGERFVYCAASSITSAVR